MDCRAITKNGKKCKMKAIKGSNYCFTHSKDIPESEKLKARSKGGKVKIITFKNPETLTKTEYEFNDSRDVRKFLEMLINGVIKNEIDLRIATGLNYLLQTTLKTLEIGELETKLRELEATAGVGNDFEKTNILNFEDW